MSKNWEVEITYVVTVAVENADNEEDALEWAQNELSFVSDLDMVESRSREVGVKEWELVKRHAHKIAESDE